jgi:hypothetical protein
MAFTDRATQSGERVVAGDECGQRGVSAFDHAGMPEVGQLGRPRVTSPMRVTSELGSSFSARWEGSR